VYSEIVNDHFKSPRHVGELPNPDAVGTAGVPGQGNYMVVHLNIRDGRITDIGFLTYGCPGAVASGSVITEMALGLTLQQAMSITSAQILENLGGLPLGKRHCPGLAVAALQAAISEAAQAPSNGGPSNSA
jgi:nitrogen fixation NifU-like protein